ncbi:MAG: 30S ribosomal protein S6, partial [Deltaproteobacteria bacterium]|nr:30S ribosomal protein S6 [Deltaproteobacteria bacterium]
MREYETVLITQPNITDADQTKINDKIASLIEKHNGKLFFAKSLGKKSMTYAIKKQTKGYYTCIDFTAEGNVVNEMEKGLRIDENVLRFLTVVKNENVDIEARLAEIVARGEDAPVEEMTAAVAAKPYAAAAVTTEVKKELAEQKVAAPAETPVAAPAETPVAAPVETEKTS